MPRSPCLCSSRSRAGWCSRPGRTSSPSFGATRRRSPDGAGRRTEWIRHQTDWRGLGINKALSRATSCSAAPSSRLYHALLGANARNLLTYDIAQQDRIRIAIDDNVGWLDFTHGITFANAVREQCTKYPELWPSALLQMACFSGRNAPYTNGVEDAEEWRVRDAGAFVDEAVEGLFDHGAGEFIVSVHLLKTVMAAREELRADPPDEVAELLAAGLNRFLHSRLKRRQVRRSVYQAMKFVAYDG